MEMQFLGDSQCIQSAGYQSGYLCIEFQDNSVYSYADVPPQVWVALKRSVSRGYYFNVKIRNNYTFFEGYPPETNQVKYIDQKYFDDLVED